MKTKFWMMTMAAGMMLALSACGSDSSESKPEDPDSVIDDKPKGNMDMGSSEEMVVNEENYIVETAGCTIELNPCIVADDTKLVVSKATEAPSMLDENDQVTAVNLQVGNLREFNGVAKIHIPVSFGYGQALISARWNESERDWEPALCEYDATRGEAVIWTDQPGTYGVSVVSAEKASTRAANTFGAFIVARANTRYAGIHGKKFHYTSWEDPPTEVLETLMSDLMGGDNEITSEGDVIAQDILDTKAIFGDITYPVLKELGLKFSLLEKTSKFMGRLAVAATFYQKLRAVYSGKFDQADGMTLKSCLDFIVGKAASICKSSAMNLGMVSVAVIDYTLNKFAEEAWKGRKDLYKEAFKLYYSKGHKGYRSFWDWYDLFWPAFTKEGMTSYRLGVLIDAYVTKYCDQIWDDEEELAYELAELGLKWTGGGGLNDATKEEISGEYKQYLYGEYEKLPKVFNAISEKLKLKQYDLMKDHMMKYADHMNEMVTLHLKDISVKGDVSAYAGCKVKFKKLPLSIIDPDDWTCILNEKGEGDIKFRLFAYAAAEVRPELVIVSADDDNDVKLTIPLGDIDTGTNVIEYAGEETPAGISSILFYGEYLAQAIANGEAQEASRYNFGATLTEEIGTITVTTKGNTATITGVGTAADNNHYVNNMVIVIDNWNGLHDKKAVIKSLDCTSTLYMALSYYTVEGTLTTSAQNVPMQGYGYWEGAVYDGTSLNVSHNSTTTYAPEYEADPSIVSISTIDDPDNYIQIYITFKDGSSTRVSTAPKVTWPTFMNIPNP